MNFKRPRLLTIRKHQEAIVISILCAFHIIFNYIWLRNDFSFFSFPHYEYLVTFEVYSWLKSGQIYIYPLYLLITSLVFFVFGPSLFLFNCISSVFLIILIIFLYLLCKELWSGRVGLLAATITSFFPFVFGGSRLFDFHVALMAMVVLSYYFLVRTYKRFTSLNCIFLFLAMVAGGLMGKWSNTETIEFLVTVSGGWMYFAWFEVRDIVVDRKNKSLYIKLIGTLLIGLSSVLYLNSKTGIFNFGDALQRTKETWIPGLIVNLTDRIISYFSYLICLPAAYIGVAFTFIFLLSLAVIIKKKIAYIGLIFLWLANTLVFFSLFIKKNIIYCELMLPAIGIIMALGLLSFRNNVTKKTFIILVVFFSICQYLLLSFYSGKYNIKDFFYQPRLNNVKFIDAELFTEVPSDELKKEITHLASLIKEDLIKMGLRDIDRPVRLFVLCAWRDVACKTTTMLYMDLEKSGLDVRLNETYIFPSDQFSHDLLLNGILPNDIVIIGEKEVGERIWGGDLYNYDYIKENPLCEKTFLKQFAILKKYVIKGRVIRLAVKRNLLTSDSGINDY